MPHERCFFSSSVFTTVAHSAPIAWQTAWLREGGCELAAGTGSAPLMHHHYVGQYAGNELSAGKRTLADQLLDLQEECHISDR